VNNGTKRRVRRYIARFENEMFHILSLLVPDLPETTRAINEVCDLWEDSLEYVVKNKS
jgi:hypothetical protein